MKKLALIMAAVMMIIAVDVYSQQNFTDETTIILDEEAPQAENDAAAGAYFTIWDFVKVILILGAVILIIYAVFFFLRRSGKRGFQENEIINIVSSKALTQGTSVHIIEVAGKYHLIGCAESSVSMLSEILDKESIDELKLKAPQDAPANRSFSDLFSGIFGSGRSSGGNIDEKIASNRKILQNQTERLKKM